MANSPPKKRNPDAFKKHLGIWVLVFQLIKLLIELLRER